MIQRRVLPILATALAALAAGCVTSSQPIGDEPAPEIAASLDGTWQLGIPSARDDGSFTLDPESTSTVVIGHQGHDRVWLTWVDPGATPPAVEIGEGVVRRHDDQPFLSVRGIEDGKVGDRYLFLRLELIDDDTVALDGPDSDQFTRAIDSGRLTGTYDSVETSPVANVRITAESGAVEAFLDSPEGAGAMSPTEHVLVRMAAGPVPPAAIR